jgi:hypothetical protein
VSSIGVVGNFESNTNLNISAKLEVIVEENSGCATVARVRCLRKKTGSEKSHGIVPARRQHYTVYNAYSNANTYTLTKHFAKRSWLGEND